MALRLPVLLLAASLVTVSLTGCGYQSTPPDGAGLAIVQGSHANAPSAAAESAAVSNAEIAAVAGQQTVSIIEADGSPYVVATADLVSTAKNATARTQEKQNYQAELQSAVEKSAPRTPQDNLLEALDLAGRSLSNRAVRRMVVRDSGLQTEGLLHFQEPGLLDAQPADVAAQVQRAHDDPAVKGDDIVLTGIGDVQPPQQPLPPAQRRNLIAIWVAILTAAGAHVSVDQTPVDGASPQSAPTVTIVPVSETVMTPPACAKPIPPQRIPAASLFRADEAVLINPSQTTQDLASFARYVIQTHGTVHLLASTAREGGRAGQIALSVARGKVIRGLLIESLHVPAGQVPVADAVGSYWPGYVTDHDAAGNLLPGPAALNRAVDISMTLPLSVSTTHSC